MNKKAKDDELPTSPFVRHFESYKRNLALKTMPGNDLDSVLIEQKIKKDKNKMIHKLVGNLIMRNINDKNNRKPREGNAKPSPQEPTTNGHCVVNHYFVTVGQCQCIVVNWALIKKL